MALARGPLGESFRRSARSQASKLSMSGFDRSWRTARRSAGGLPLISRSMANNLSIRVTASMAIGILRKRANSKNLRRL